MGLKNKKVKSKKTGQARVVSVEEIEGAKVFENNPDYIIVNGYVYEKQGKPEEGANLALDLDASTVEIIKNFREKNPGYMNDAEVIREALRNSFKLGTL